MAEQQIWLTRSGGTMMVILGVLLILGALDPWIAHLRDWGAGAF